MNNISGSGDLVAGPATASGEGRVLSGLQRILDESQDTLNEEVLGHIGDFFKSRIEEITGMPIETVEDYVRENTPGHLLEYVQFIAEAIEKVLSQLL